MPAMQSHDYLTPIRGKRHIKFKHNTDCVTSNIIGKQSTNNSKCFKIYLTIYLSLDTATRPHGHSRQVSAASNSIRQKRSDYKKKFKSMIVRIKTDDRLK